MPLIKEPHAFPDMLTLISKRALVIGFCLMRFISRPSLIGLSPCHPDIKLEHEVIDQTGVKKITGSHGFYVFPAVGLSHNAPPDQAAGWVGP